LIQINQTSATAKQQHQHGGDVVTDTERQGLFRNPLKSLMKWIAQEAEKLADYVTGWSAGSTHRRQCCRRQGRQLLGSKHGQ
jgi:hypothetical protein